MLIGALQLVLVLLLLSSGAESYRTLHNSQEYKKQLYCKATGGCEECQAGEEGEPYCTTSGFKEVLECVESRSEGTTSYTVSITPPYPEDVVLSERDPDEAFTRVSRSCTQSRMRANNQALIKAYERPHVHHMSLWGFELVMLVMLGASLPVVYWRKIRIRHL